MINKKRGFLWALWVIITIVAILHIIRAVLNWSLIVEIYPIPIWLSYLAFLILGFLSYKLFCFLKNQKF